jgi:hypothetical protein
VGTQRASDRGTLTRAKCSSTALSGSRSSTASDSDRLEMYGNGCPGSTASGVSTGNTCASKNSSTRIHSAGVRSAIRTKVMPWSASAGSSSSSRQRSRAASSSRTRARTAASCSPGVIPSGGYCWAPCAAFRRSPATRTM